MKKLLFLFIFATTTQLSFSQGKGLHYQFHGDATANSYKYNEDTLIFPITVANTSTYNAIGIVNLKTETWSTTSYSTAFSFSYANTPTIVMKNLNEGICTTIGNQLAYSTSNFWQTTAPLTGTVNALGATKFGYYGYRSVAGCGSCTYSISFSTNGSSWSNALIELNSFNPPVFTKSKNKIYTIHNNLLKASVNGGSSYNTVSGTYTFNITYPVIPKIMTLNDDTIFVNANQFHRSFDGGATWSVIAIPTASSNVGQIESKKGNELLIIEKFTPYNVHYSNNSGNSWTTYTAVPQFYKTGEKLNSAPSTSLYDLTHTNDIVLAGFAQGYFGYSTNRGQNFTFLPNKIPSNIDAMAVKADNINKFYVADRKGQIFMSTNQGQTWTQKTTSAFNNPPRKFTLSQNSNNVVLSCIGGPWMSTDGGNTFAGMSLIGGGQHYQTVKPTSGAVIDVGSQLTGTVSTWQFYSFSSPTLATTIGSVVCLPTEEMIDIQMRDDNVGYFMTRNSANNETIVYKTTNGWLTTTSISAIPSPTITYKAYDGRYGNVQLLGQDTVIISGSGNVVANQTDFYHISKDGGLTWTKINTDFSYPTSVLGNRVYKLMFFNSTNYLGLISSNLSGSGQASSGVYLNAEGSVSQVGISELTSKIDNKTLVIYPNPAHDQLTLKTDGFNIENFKVEIINTIGQTVFKTEVNTNTLDVSDLKRGIYFITLKNKNNHYSGKFIKE